MANTLPIPAGIPWNVANQYYNAYIRAQQLQSQYNQYNPWVDTVNSLIGVTGNTLNNYFQNQQKADLQSNLFQQQTALEMMKEQAALEKQSQLERMRLLNEQALKDYATNQTNVATQQFAKNLGGVTTDTFTPNLPAPAEFNDQTQPTGQANPFNVPPPSYEYLRPPSGQEAAQGVAAAGLGGQLPTDLQKLLVPQDPMEAAKAKAQLDLLQAQTSEANARAGQLQGQTTGPGVAFQQQIDRMRLDLVEKIRANPNDTDALKRLAILNKPELVMGAVEKQLALQPDFQQWLGGRSDIKTIDDFWNKPAAERQALINAFTAEKRAQKNEDITRQANATASAQQKVPAADLPKLDQINQVIGLTGRIDELAKTKDINLPKIMGGIAPWLNEIAQTGRIGKLIIPEGLRPQLTDNQMAILTNMESLADLVKLGRTGAQGSEAEFQRMVRGFLATQNLTPQAFLVRLQEFENFLLTQDRSLRGTLESSGNMPLAYQMTPFQHAQRVLMENGRPFSDAAVRAFLADPKNAGWK